MVSLEMLTDGWPLYLYKGKNNIDDILDWLWDANKIFQCETHTLRSSGKSEERAEKLRDEGNRYYKNRNFEKALEFYNLSIMAAPHPVLRDVDLSSLAQSADDEDLMYASPLIDPSRYGGVPVGKSITLAKAFGNRSAVLFVLGFYEKCQEDIDLSLEYGFPKELAQKLEDRKKKCSSAQKSSLNKDKNSLKGKRDSQRKGKKDLSSVFQDFLANEGNEATASFTERLSTEAQRVPQIQHPNPRVSSLSSAVDIAHTAYAGRGIVATKDISTGELLGVERAYIVGLDKAKLSNYCSTCTELCLTPLPCPGCSTVIFCSKHCRTRGLAEDHWYDCKILSSMISLGLGHKANAYKMFKTFSFRQLKAMDCELQKEESDDSKILGFNSKGFYSSTSYQPFYHFSQQPEHDEPGILMGEGVLSFLIATFLEQSQRFFVNALGEPVPVTKEDFLETCKALYYSGVRKRMNSFDLRKDKGDGDFVVFSVLSLINHSCYPSGCVVNFGRQSILVATRPIKAGEEVTTTYRHPFEREETALRRQRLRIYNFECHCEACDGDWPMLLNLPHKRFLCLKCSVPQPLETVICSSCERKLKKGSSAERKLISMQKIELESAIAEVMKMSLRISVKDSFSKEEVQNFRKSSEIIQRNMYMPCGIPVLVKDLIVSLVMDGYFYDT